jgi:hypothetical protein
MLLEKERKKERGGGVNLDENYTYNISTGDTTNKLLTTPTINPLS